MIRQYNETNFVTSLRALAATMVVVIHTGAFQSFGQVGENITGAGKYGVEMFFVISGFSIAVTFFSAPSYKSFLTRRLFRIAPLYIFVITAVFWLTRWNLLPETAWLRQFGMQLDAYNYLLHISFLSFLDHRIGNSILGVEWSIPIEVFWYALLPLILVKTSPQKNLANAFYAAILAIVITRGLSQWLIQTSPSLFAKWFPTNYGPYFLLGVVAYRLRQGTLRSETPGRLHQHATTIVRGCFVALPAILAFNLPVRGLLLGILTCLIIGLFDRRSHPFLAQTLEFRPFLYLGTISYSVYLTHFPVANFLLDRQPLGSQSSLGLFFTVISITVVIATFLYRWVEEPTNAIGKRFANKTRSVVPMPQQTGPAALHETKSAAPDCP